MADTDSCWEGEKGEQVAMLIIIANRVDHLKKRAVI